MNNKSDEEKLKNLSSNYLIADYRDNLGEREKALQQMSRILFDEKYHGSTESLTDVTDKVEKALDADDTHSFKVNRDKDDIEFYPGEMEWGIFRSWPKRRVKAHENNS